VNLNCRRVGIHICDSVYRHRRHTVFSSSRRVGQNGRRFAAYWTSSGFRSNPSLCLDFSAFGGEVKPHVTGAFDRVREREHSSIAIGTSGRRLNRSCLRFGRTGRR
jgi:hypothetical protein